MRLRLCGILLIALAAGACAPWHRPPGPPVAPPTLSETHLRLADGTALPLRRWGRPAPGFAQPRAVILALHGFNDYSKAFEGPAAALARAGIATYAYDQRGFGEAPHRGFWSGVEAMTGDLRTAARLIRDAHPETPFFILGESMGAAVVMAALGETNGGHNDGGEKNGGGHGKHTNPLAADGYILSAPAVWARRVMPFWQRLGLEVFAHTIPLFHVTGQGFNRVPSDNRAMLRQLGRDPLVIKHTRIDTLYGLVNLMDAALDAAPHLPDRTLILFGQKEDIVPSDAMQALRRALPTGRCVQVARYRSGYHMLLRDLKADVVLADLAAWTRRPGRALPSGADGAADDGRADGRATDTAGVTNGVTGGATNSATDGARDGGGKIAGADGRVALSCAPPLATRP